MKYPYLVASLPTLSLDVLPRTQVDAFVNRCEGVLSDEDHKELIALLDEDRLACGSQFSASWFVFEAAFRHLIAEVRAGRLGLDPRTAVGFHDEGTFRVRSAVVDAFAKSNPREREWSLDQARWKALEDLGAEQPFGLSAVLAHALQLRLAHRWASMNEEKGKQNLNEHLEAILGADEGDSQ